MWWSNKTSCNSDVFGCWLYKYVWVYVYTSKHNLTANIRSWWDTPRLAHNPTLRWADHLTINPFLPLDTPDTFMWLLLYGIESLYMKTQSALHPTASFIEVFPLYTGLHFNICTLIFYSYTGDFIYAVEWYMGSQRVLSHRQCWTRVIL